MENGNFCVIELKDTTLSEDLISYAAFSNGALGLELLGTGHYKIYFEDKAHQDSFLYTLQELVSIGNRAKLGQVTSTLIYDQGWASSWRQYFEPLEVSKDLIILAPWQSKGSFPHRYKLIIDPGPAFGTGRHPTTRMCLRAMEKVCEELTPGWSAIDIGTGSGILAIYAAMRGAGEVLGIDIDGEALSWARRAVEINGLSNVIELSSVPIGDIDQAFDLVLANLDIGIFNILGMKIWDRVGRGGWVIISGILQNEKKALINLLPFCESQIRLELTEEDWLCLAIKNA